MCKAVKITGKKGGNPRLFQMLKTPEPQKSGSGVFDYASTSEITPLCRKNSSRCRTGFPVMRAMAAA